MQVDAVEERTRQPALVIFGAAWRAPATGFGEMAAAARVHRRNQLKPRRIGDVPVGPGDADTPALEWLAQRFERSAVELRNYVAVSPRF